MWFSGDRKRMFTHQLTTVTLASRNPINGCNEEKEGRNGRKIMKRGMEWTNRKYGGRFGDSWGCCLLAVIVSR